MARTSRPAASAKQPSRPFTPAKRPSRPARPAQPVPHRTLASVVLQLSIGLAFWGASIAFFLAFFGVL